MTAQDRVREVLFDATAVIPSEELAGVVFAAGLIATDHIFNIVGEVGRWVRTQF